MTAKKKTEAKVTTAATYEGNSAPPERTPEKRIYFNGVTHLIMTPDEFDAGGYAMQAFVDIAPADPEERVDGVVDDAPEDDEA